MSRSLARADVGVTNRSSSSAYNVSVSTESARLSPSIARLRIYHEVKREKDSVEREAERERGEGGRKEEKRKEKREKIKVEERGDREREMELGGDKERERERMEFRGEGWMTRERLI